MDSDQIERRIVSHERRLGQRKDVESRAAYGHFAVGSSAWASIAALDQEFPTVDNGATHVLTYGLALCVPGDQFSRKRGREKSLTRLIARVRHGSGAIMNVPVPQSFPLSGAVKAKGPTLVARLREAVVEHLFVVAARKDAPVWLRAMRLRIENAVSGPNGKTWEPRS